MTIGLNRLQMVKLLLENGANPNLGIDNGRAEEMPDNSTPLHFAAYSGANDILELLLKYRAEVNSPDMNGRTPIMIAAGQNHSDTVEILEQAGSRMEARDYWCETRMNMSQICGYGSGDQLKKKITNRRVFRF